MNLSAQIAKNLRDVYFGKNWTAVSMQQSLADVTWQQATTKVYSCNTIAALVYHINYYVSAVTKFLQGEPLDSRDEISFDLPPIHSQEDWQMFLEKTWREAEQFACLIEQLPESRFDEIFVEEKYGNYYRNIHGIIEHAHYHLGQIVLLKKIISLTSTTNGE